MVWDVILGALQILGSLGFFLYGIKLMSDSLQKAAGIKLRQFLSAMTTNRYMGVMTGFLITAILQSSSLTTAMTVGFVNAGLLNLVESAGIMLGANIGTTITGWLVSLMGFQVKMGVLALPLIAFGMPLLFASRQQTKNYGQVLIGFALLLLGLEALKESVPDFRDNPEVFAFIQQFSNPGVLGRLLFVFIGAMMTIIMQSSSASMTLTIALTLNGLPMDIAVAMVLGENIGTTITAEIAALVGNAPAKRSARVHSLFNIIGVSWMLFLSPYFLEFIYYLFPAQTSGDQNVFALAAFHTGFNFLNVFIMIWFLGPLVRLASNSVKEKQEDQTDADISSSIFSDADIPLHDSKDEIIKMSKELEQMSQQLCTFIESKPEDAELVYKTVITHEIVVTDMKKKISAYLRQYTSESFNDANFDTVQNILYIVGGLNQITELCIGNSNALKRILVEDDGKETDETKKILYRLFLPLSKNFAHLSKNLDSDHIDQIQARTLFRDVNDTVRHEISALKEDQIHVQELIEIGERINLINADILSVSLALTLEGDLD